MKPRHAIAICLIMTALAGAAASCDTQASQRISAKPREVPMTQTTASGWQPNPAQIAELAAKNTTWIYRESDVPAYTLPDPLRAADGTTISTRQQWEQKGRPETLALFEQHVFGRQPGRPDKIEFEVLATNPAALNGRATHKRVRITTHLEGKSFAFTCEVMIPNNRPGKIPAFVSINIVKDRDKPQQSLFWPAEDIVNRGYATAMFYTWDVDPDKDGAEARAAGVRGVFKGPGEPGKDAWGTIAAWAWGASRVLDYLNTEPAIDASRVAVIGHSRGGKTALWAGATDSRFAYVISNDSGCGGAAISRRCFGETVQMINKNFPYWFCGNFHGYDNRENELPIDQHQLIALIAPRPVYVASATEDFWADPRGEFLSLAAASEVYALCGNAKIGPTEMPPADSPLIRGRLAYHIRTGPHRLAAYDWDRYLDFAGQQWK